MIGKIIFIFVESYLLGSIPFGYLLYRLRQGGDVRATGSGNIGATNVLRGAGMAAGAATLLLDAGKGYLAVVIAAHLSGGTPEWMSLAAVIAIAGHIFPAFLRFRGGKGVATGFGAFLGLAPLPVLWCTAIFVLIGASSRYISLASIAAMAAFPLVLLAYGPPSADLVAALVGSALIISRHRSNIHRLLTRSERQMPSARELRNSRAAPR